MRAKTPKQWTLPSKLDGPPTLADAVALVRRFRAQLKERGVTRLTPLPFVPAAVAPWQWRIRGVRVVGQYSLGQFTHEGFYLRADALERAS